MKNVQTTMAAAAILTVAGAQAQSNWTIDASHSKVQFTVTHLMISEVTGKFKVYEGKVVATKDDFSDSQIEFSADVNSINTDDEGRDKHLKSDDFFNAEKYPKMTFKSKSFKKVSGKNYKLIGDLTIRDITKSVEFDVVYNGSIKDPWGNTKAGFKLIGVINRIDYGLKWNAAVEAGGVVVSEKVNITCDIELGKQK
ncbi:MAG: YceI family protein [Bacteroidia bacterium]|nr:YceI family protein [Bacteroidia bacterium]